MKPVHFFQTTRAPLLSILSDESVPQRRRRVWIIALLMGLLAFGAHLVVLVLRLRSMPLIVQFTQSEDPFIFPDITLCHTGPYSWHRTLDTSKRYNVSHEISASAKEIVTGVRTFWRDLLPKLRTQDVAEGFSRKENAVAKFTIYGLGLRLGFGHESHESILDCYYRGFPCSFLNFTTITVPKYLNCFTLSFQNSDKQLVDRSGERHGLLLLLMDADRRRLMTEWETLDFLRGFKVYIHEPGTYPNDENFVTAQVGKLTKISLRMTSHAVVNLKHSPCVQKPKDVTVCIHPDDEECEKFRMTANLCRNLQLQAFMTNICGCYFEELPLPKKRADNITFCHDVDPRYFLNDNGPILPRSDQNLSEDQNLSAILARHNCQENVTNSVDDKMLNPLCFRSCERNTYASYVSVFDWPTAHKYARRAFHHFGHQNYDMAKTRNLKTTILEKFILNASLNNTVQMRKRFARLLIYPKSSIGAAHREILAYPWSAFLSDVGAILGLWVGFSMITIVELIEWILTRTVQWFKKLRRREQTTKTGVSEERKLSPNENKNGAIQ